MFPNRDLKMANFATEPYWSVELNDAEIDRNYVAALGRGLAVLEAFCGRSDPWMSVSDVVNALQLPQPTVTRFLRSLLQSGYLHFSEQKRAYRLSALVLTLGYGARSRFVPETDTKQLMQDLANSYGAHVGFVERDFLDAVYLDVCHSETTLATLQIDQGYRLPIGVSPAGQVLLASLPRKEFLYFIDLVSRLQETQSDEHLSALKSARRSYQKSGYVAGRSLGDGQTYSIAVPVDTLEGSRGYCIVCSWAEELSDLSKESQIYLKIQDYLRQSIPGSGQVSDIGANKVNSPRNHPPDQKKPPRSLLKD